MTERRCDIDDLEIYLGMLSRDINADFVHWVHGDDEAECWCYSCCYYRVRHLRRRNKKNREDYCVDGGWGTEEDGSCFCAGCGKPLDHSLTDYGVRSELDHFLHYEYPYDEYIDPLTAFELLRAFEGARYSDNKNIIEGINLISSCIYDHTTGLEGLVKEAKLWERKD